MPALAPDFKEFLQLLRSNGVEYLMVGGYAVIYYGYPRSTADMDIWIRLEPDNVARLVTALHTFGFPSVNDAMFLEGNRRVQLGFPPVQIEIHPEISGMEFDSCYATRNKTLMEGIQVDLLCLKDLRENKKSAGRHKDLDDLEHLPSGE